MDAIEFEAPTPTEYTQGITGVRPDWPFWQKGEEVEPDEPDCV
ncbi:hypothetical protein [Nocardia niwae]|nr:hypothetical protein [Nocardia niwae]